MVLWSDWLVFCDYGLSVSALWCPLATPTVLLGFLLPWTWDISSWLLQQSTVTAPYLGRGLSSHGCPSWSWMWHPILKAASWKQLLGWKTWVYPKDRGGVRSIWLAMSSSWVNFLLSLPILGNKNRYNIYIWKC